MAAVAQRTPLRQIEAMQRRLTELGFYSDGIDGKAGMATRVALGRFQKSKGLAARLLAERRCASEPRECHASRTASCRRSRTTASCCGS